MENTLVREQNHEQGRKNHNRRLIFYHANPKGTGTAAQFELRLNRMGEDRYDCFFLEMAHQKTMAAAGDRQKGPATFDWTNKVTVKLDFIDISKFLAVLDGKCEQVGDGKGGIYHESNGSNTLISFKRSPDTGGFLLAVSKKSRDGTQIFKGHIVLNEVEALGLSCVFRTALFFMAFGAVGSS